MNVGTARYWIGRPDERHGWVLVDLGNRPGHPPAPLEEIDRGPVNRWTGKPH